MITRLARPVAAALGALAFAAILPGAATAQQGRLTSPQQQFGHEIGADYVLPNYSDFVAYWQKLAAESDRMVLDTIGLTAEGRPQLMAIVTSPENQRNLDRYRDIARQLARAEGVDSAQARQLAADGKAIVWIDGGLHATEVLGAQQLMEIVWQLVSDNDPETTRILNDVIVLAVHANPDGMQLVSDWYMREADPKKRSTGGIPRLYQKYVGHDNNRDFFLGSQPETINMLRVAYREWYPQILYNHHQTGPAGTVMFHPPFRDPANYNFHPLITSGLDVVGSAMMNRFIAENKPGTTIRSGAPYSTWWNGGLRTIGYFHNVIGILTETIGNPTPQTIPFIPDKQIRSADLPFPIAPQEWHFRQSIDYSVTANRAILDLASRYREKFLFDIWKMGHDAIQAGSRDSWTIEPGDIEAITEKMQSSREGSQAQGGRFNMLRGGEAEYRSMRTPENRDPRAYVIPANQADFLTATKFVNTLLKNGIDVYRASAPVTVSGRSYPAGSYVVKTNQAYRPHVLDMFEPQDHPHDVQYPGGPPVAPYDNAGWTLAMQMGVNYARSLEDVSGSLEKITGDTLSMPAGTVASAPSSGGWSLSHQTNDAFYAINRILAEGGEVYWEKGAGAGVPQGTFFIPQSAKVRQTLETLARERGLSFTAASSRPAGATKLSPRRIGLVDRYGGSMPSGWTRFVLENFGFNFDVVFPQQLDAGNLRQKYDVLVFVDGMIPAVNAGGRGFGFGGGGPDASTLPAELRGMVGNVTVEKTIPELKKFAEAGGTILTIGSSTSLGQHFGLPISNYMVERTPEGTVKPLTSEQYYIPGSLLEVRVDSTNPVAQGMGGRAIVMFDNSPVFRLDPGASFAGVRPVAWFDSATPLRSGWAWGQGYLDGGVAVAEADVGRGKLVMYGPEILFRAQPHGTFKLLFNGIYAGQ